MAINVIGVAPGHNGSVTLLQDGKIALYIEEERLSRIKRDSAPLASLVKVVEMIDHLDALVVVGTGPNTELPWSGFGLYDGLVKKLRPQWRFEVVELHHSHHLTHAACALRNSGFDEAAILVIDGAGSGHHIGNALFWETESLFVGGGAGLMLAPVYQNLRTNFPIRWDKEMYEASRQLPQHVVLAEGVGIVKAYEAVTHFCGFPFIEAGKTMGLAPYGKGLDTEPHLNNLWHGDSMSFASDAFRADYPAGATLRLNHRLTIQGTEEGRKEAAYKVQKATEEAVECLVRKAIEITGKTKICLAGGYGLNVCNNYALAKKFPEVEFFFDPLCFDGGNSLGAASLVAAQLHQRATGGLLVQEPLNNLYLGPVYDPAHYDFSGFDTVIEATPMDVASMIADGQLVTVFQGRSEGGPRALGNRSILSDPRPEDGKDRVNAVKRREWFRPFAGVAIKEKAGDWFDFAGRDGSPFMMMAVDVIEDKRELIPAITHVDGTCRVQTLTRAQNPHLYRMLEAFDALTGVPMVMNTSLNLGGEALVETVADVLRTLRNSDLDWCWFPERGVLVKAKKIETTEEAPSAV